MFLSFILLTVCTKIVSFRYKSSKRRKNNPLFRESAGEEGTHSWSCYLLWMQRYTKYQVSFLGAGIGCDLSEDGY